MTKPKLRMVRAFPAQVGEQQALALADARQITDQVVVTAPAMQLVLPLMNGERTVEQIVTEVGRGLTREVLEPFIAQLDHAALLFGPAFEAVVAKMREQFDSSPVLPPATTAAFVDNLVMQETAREMGIDGAQLKDQEQVREAQERVQERFAALPDSRKDEIGATKLREVFEQWIAAALKDVPNPSFDALPKAVVAPHIDYPRGWMNYAAVWGRMRVVDRPDRVVVLGTNHFGDATGVTACDKGYRTVLGTCELDAGLLDALKAKLGRENAEKLLKNRYDHEREHSIELQIPWIQHVIGADAAGNFPKVLGVLVHDPCTNNGESYDGQGLAFEPFVAALREALAMVPGKTLIVSSADLSHVGAAFGDVNQQGQAMALAGEEEGATQNRNRVFQHDREMLMMLAQNKPDDLIAAMGWQQNPTRWCSVGNMVAAVKVTQPTQVNILNYSAAMDQQGMGMVSSCAMVMN